MSVMPAMCASSQVSEVARYRLAVAKRRRDRWTLGPALSLPEAAYGGPVYDLAEPDAVLAWVTFPDRSLEVEARVIAYTERAALVEWGFSQAAECAWVWRDAVSPRLGPADGVERGMRLVE
ncbi:hypothetical protein DEJ00_01340 [Curtobacterium sp. MCLR17_039]|nr:hypothetical protein DEJ00_01340 [Curtobacterium sp. MCLR17_039]